MFKETSSAPANALPMYHEHKNAKNTGPADETSSIVSWPERDFSDNNMIEKVRHIPLKVITY